MELTTKIRKVSYIIRNYGFFYFFHQVFITSGTYFLSKRLKKIFKVNKLSVHMSAKLKGISNIDIGENFRAGKDFWLEAVLQDGCQIFQPKIIIKDNVIINDYVHIAATNRVEIGNNVLMASKIYISDHNHGCYSGDKHSHPNVEPRLRELTANESVIIGDNVWLGEFVSILPGVSIGNNCIIGSNSVVARSIPRNSIVVGSPARVIKMFNNFTNRWEKPSHKTAQEISHYELESK